VLEELKNIQDSRKNLRNFGLSVGSVCMAVGGFLFWKEIDAYPYLLAIGLMLACCGSIWPLILKPVYLAWMGLAVVLGSIMTRLILGLLFYLIITPIALVSKLTGNRFIDLRWGFRQPTYWNDLKSKRPTRERYEKQF